MAKKRNGLSQVIRVRCSGKRKKNKKSEISGSNLKTQFSS